MRLDRLLKALAWLTVGILRIPLSAPVPAWADEATRFVEVEIDFEHHWIHSVHPFLGAAVIDIDNDGRFEIFVGGGQDQPDALFAYRQGEFHNIVEGTGLSRTSATYGPKAIDMDADGDTDMVIARNDGVWLYTNDGHGHFAEQRIAVDLPPQSVPFDVAIGDVDRDGDPDLAIMAARQAPQLHIFRNDFEGRGASLALRLVGTTGNRDAIGARVTVETERLRRTKVVHAGSGFLSQHSKELLFGLGTSERVLKLTVDWPSGHSN